METVGQGTDPRRPAPALARRPPRRGDAPRPPPPDAPAADRPRSRALARWLSPLLGLGLFAVALVTLGSELRAYHLRDLLAPLDDIPASRIALALAFCAFNYFVLTRYDVLALRYVGQPLPHHRIALASFVASALSNNVGFSVLSGGSIRYRMYTAYGISAADTARIVAFVTASFWLGFLVIGGAVFLLDAPAGRDLGPLPAGAVPWVGAVFLIAWAAYAFVALRPGRPLRVRGLEFDHLTPRALSWQVLVAALDWISISAVLYVLLPAGAVPFLSFLSVYLVALLAGMVSQVPGGIGVFESVLLVLLSQRVGAPNLAAALLVYRVLYYLVPLGAAVALLGLHEVAQRREHLQRLTLATARWASPMVPSVLAFGGFLAGMVLLLSGATPGVHTRLRWLDAHLPLGVVELAHWLGALVGAQLLLVARGLHRRLARAWWLGTVLLAAGIAVSLLKGLDWEEAAVLSLMLAVLVASRAEFYRIGGLLQEPFAAGWAVAALLGLVTSVALGLFAYKHVAYSHALFWQFEATGDASRFLRGSVGAFGVALFFAVAHFVGPRRPEPSLPGPEELERAAALVARSRDTSAHLALLGDKSLLFNEAGTAFVMYARQAGSHVAMGDPIGTPREQRELAWRFRELADRHNTFAVFYEVSAETLPVYVDLGLSLQKLGEEAIVALQSFTLEGHGAKGLRSACNRLEREDFRLEILPAGSAAVPFRELRAISESWLAQKRTREKGFSLGFFDERYLSRCPIALVRQGGSVRAFANLWVGAEHEELSFDLMRFAPDVPHGVMDFLFAQLMLWGKAQGFRTFNLGMAPLSGFERHPLAPAWNRLASLVYRQGEQFYNFQGLRAYKEKFHPAWRPRYLAAPRGFALPLVIADVLALISRGMKGVVAR